MILRDEVLKRIDPAERVKMGKAGLTAAECHEIAVAKCERELQNQIENLLRLNGVNWPMRQRMDKRSNLPKGTPDILFTFKGVSCAWEVKMPGKKPDEDQERALRDLTADGVRCAVVFTYDQALALLAEIRKGD